MSDAKLPLDANLPPNDKLPSEETPLSGNKLTAEMRLGLWSFLVVVLLAYSTFVASHRDFRQPQDGAAPTVPTPPLASPPPAAPSLQPATIAAPVPTAPLAGGQETVFTVRPSVSPSLLEHFVLQTPRELAGSGNPAYNRQVVSHNAQGSTKQDDLNRQELDRLATKHVASPQVAIVDLVGLIIADGGPKPLATKHVASPQVDIADPVGLIIADRPKP